MFDESGPRRVVPRWRSSWRTAESGEAKSNRAPRPQDLSGAIREAKLDFDAINSVPAAAELMFIANEARDDELARMAATRILINEEQISSSSLIAAARRIETGDAYRGFDGPRNDFVREARRLLRRDFNNPVLLTDVALALTGSGRGKAAERFMRTALALAPDNRFVTRSAVRYFLHRGFKDEAHRILLRSKLLASDPWIQASEVAVATVLGKSSKQVKKIDQFLSRVSVLPPNLSELGSAIATVHLNSGSDKLAKKLFAKTLISPNDNVVAQAEWAAKSISLVVGEAALNVPFSFEANSAHSYRNLDVERAILEAKAWKDDEPFASRPVGWLAHLFAISDRFEEAVEYHQLVLEMENENSTGTLLNLNFSRIETGALEQATTQLIHLSKALDAKDHRSQILANAGALAYSGLNFELGRMLYSEAAKAAKAISDTRTEMMVRAFFSRAAVKYGDPQAQQILAETSSNQNLKVNPSATFVVGRLVDIELQRRLEATARKRVAKQQLEWDPATNVLRLLG